MQWATKLVRHLATEFGVNIRDEWRPDAAWLAGFQKIQLSHVIAKLGGPVCDPAAEMGKKSELVVALAVLFTEVGEGKLECKVLAARLTGWIPANLRGSDSVAT